MRATRWQQSGRDITGKSFQTRESGEGWNVTSVSGPNYAQRISTATETKSRWFPIAGTARAARNPSLNPLSFRKTTPAYDVEQYTWNECARIPVQTPVPGPALF